MSLKRVFALAAGVAATVTASGAALAQDVIGQPLPDQLGLQPAATVLAEELHHFHNVILMPLITIISLFVMGLLLWIIVRYNSKANPVPSKTTHHTLLEVVWTVVPVLILLMISIPSVKLLYHQLEIPKPDLTIKAIGHQWYWSYEYPDNGNFTFESRILARSAEEATQKNAIRLLDTDNEVVLPVGKNIRIQVTAADVIHSWTIPSFGIKHDGIPGRVNESWFNIDRPGIYYGQCSELCGNDHAYMPIKVRAVSPEDFEKWVAEAQTKFDKVEAPAASNLPLPVPALAKTDVAVNAIQTNTQIQPSN